MSRRQQINPAPPLRRALLVATAALLLLLSGGCGSGEESGQTITVTGDGSAPTTGTPSTSTGSGVGGGDPIEVETADEPAKLPNGWRRASSREAGFSVGLPPGWTRRPLPRAPGSVLRSPDDLVVVTISADRSPGALRLPLREFARRTAEALGRGDGPGGLKEFELNGVGPFPHRYDAVAARGTGVSRATGVRERVLAVVIRREGLATYVAVVRSNDENDSSSGDRETVQRLLRSIRGRPPA